MEQTLPNPTHTASVRTIQRITIAWMTVELCVSLYSGIEAHSVALTAFGADSAIELISAVVVLRRFTVGPAVERRAARISGTLLYALAAYIIAISGFALLKYGLQPEPTLVGICLLVAAATIMPLLGRAKKRLAAKTGSRALNADAAQSNICAYLSWIALAGLLVNFFFHLAWADSVAALLLLPIVLKEAGEATKGDVCQC
ncbi:cation transporter [soil metagenome]|jgi:divalent metal cation (Fe/Co/Zn/Cd) transporter